MYCGMSPSRFCNAAMYAGFPGLGGPSFGAVAPPSSLYWVQRSLSTSSAHNANRSRSASPLLSFPELVDCALSNAAPGSNVAPTTPRPLIKERRATAVELFGSLLLMSLEAGCGCEAFCPDIVFSPIGQVSV